MNPNDLYKRLLDLLFCVTVLAAVMLRWPDQTQPVLWLNEAWRAMGAVANHDTQILLASELVLGRVGVALFGYQSIAVRIWPLIFSVLALLGTYAFVSRTSSRGAAVSAVLLIALGPGFVHHARGFEPYPLDLALTVWSLWFAVRYTELRTRNSLSALIVILLLYAASSLTFAFVYPAILAFVCLSGAREQPRALWLLLAPGLLFTAIYIVYLRPQLSSGEALRYWGQFYIDSPEALARVAANARFDIGRFVPIGWQVVCAAYFVALPTLAVVARSRSSMLLFVPFIVQAGFSAAGLYPLFARPSYYLYGLMAIALPHVVATCLRWRAHPDSLRPKLIDAALVAGIAMTLAVSSPLRAQLGNARSWPVEQGGDAFRILAEQHKPGEAVYVSYSAYYTHRFHALREGSAAAKVPVTTAAWEEALRDNSMSKLCASIKRGTRPHHKGDRIWFVSTNVPHAHIFYRELFRTIAHIEVPLAEMHQSLIAVTLRKNLKRMGCP